MRVQFFFPKGVVFVKDSLFYFIEGFPARPMVGDILFVSYFYSKECEEKFTPKYYKIFIERSFTCTQIFWEKDTKGIYPVMVLS